MGADEAKSLRAMRPDVAGIEEIAETTSPVMEGPSPDDKVFAEVNGRLVALTWDETCRAIRSVEVLPCACSIRRLDKEEAYNLGLGELLPFNEKIWLFSILEKGPDPEISGRLIRCQNPRKLQAETVVTDEGYVCDAAVSEIKEEIGLAKPVGLCEKIARRDGMANPKTNRLPTRSRKDLKKAKVEQKALKRILREISGVYGILTEKFPLLCANGENLLPVYFKDSESAYKVLTFKAFLGSALHVPTQQRIGILVFLFSLLQYVTQNSISTTPSQFDGALSFGEAIFALTPQIAHTTLFIISYIMSWTLVLPLNPGLLIFLGVILIFGPFLLLPYMVRHSSASGIHVACRGFKLSVIAFVGVVTFAFCLFFAAVALTGLYAIWCFMYRMKPVSGQDFEVTGDLTSQMLEELNANDNV